MIISWSAIAIVFLFLWLALCCWMFASHHSDNNCKYLFILSRRPCVHATTVSPLSEQVSFCRDYVVAGLQLQVKNFSEANARSLYQLCLFQISPVSEVMDKLRLQPQHLGLEPKIVQQRIPGDWLLQGAVNKSTMDRVVGVALVFAFNHLRFLQICLPIMQARSYLSLFQCIHLEKIYMLLNWEGYVVLWDVAPKRCLESQTQ